MSIDKSLKIGNRLVRARSVLSRAERIATLRDSDRWEEGRSVFGLPKVRVRRAKRRVKAPKAEVAEAVEGAEAAVPAEGEKAAAPESREKQKK